MKSKSCIQIFLAVILITTFSGSCKKFLEVGPPTVDLVSETVFENEAMATAALLSIYVRMENQPFLYPLVSHTGLSSDELQAYTSNSDYVDLASNNLTATNSRTLSLWTQMYGYIYQANAILKGLDNSSNLQGGVVDQVKGESFFIRAFCHFYLSGLFGNIPVITTTDYTINSSLPRMPKSTVNMQILQDLDRAIELLNDNYIGPSGSSTSERTRPNKSTAMALKARLELYNGNWEESENSATAVLQNPLYSIVNNLNNVFLKNSLEAIWQIPPRDGTYHTTMGGQMILSGSPSLAAIRHSFLQGFETGDNRITSWIKSITVGTQTYYFSYKYKSPQNSTALTEYTMIFRLAEMYLIRSEARLKQNDIQGALDDLNVIRTRAGLVPFSNVDTDEIMQAISTERRNELFLEIGDRWLNLKRTQEIDTIMTSVKGNDWTVGVDSLYPIPQTEILRNKELDQNTGY